MNKREKLERAGWSFKTMFASLEIYGRNDTRVLYDPKHDEIISVYGGGITSHKPDEYEFETLCEYEK